MSIRKRSSRIMALVLAALLSVGCFSACKNEKDPGEKPKKTPVPAATPEPTEEPEPENPVAGGTLRLGVSSFDTLNPLVTKNDNLRLYLGLVTEPLVRVNGLMEAEPCLFSSWESNAQKTVWQFRTAENITFQDGSLLSAELVKKTVDFILNQGGNYRGNLENVGACFAVDGTTVQFVLKEPDGRFPNRLNIPVFSEASLTEKPVWVLSGSGTFRQASFSEGKLLLEKNETYRQPEELPLYIDRVEITAYGSTEAALRADSDMELIHGENVTTDFLRDNAGYECFTGDTYEYLAVNCTNSYMRRGADGEGESSYISLKNPLAQAELRRVVNLVTKRTKALASAGRDCGVISLLPIRSGTAYRCQQQDDYEYSEDKAKTLLKSLGYRFDTEAGSWFSSEGEELILYAICPVSNYRLKQLVNTCVDGLRAIGVKTEVEELFTEDFIRRLENKEFMLAPVELDTGGGEGVEKVLRTDGALNFSHYSSTKMDGYLDRIRSLTEPGTVIAAYNAIEEIVLEETPIIGLFFADDTIVVGNRLKGVEKDRLYRWDIFRSMKSWWVTE